MNTLGKIYLGNTLVSSGEGGGGDDKRIVFFIDNYMPSNGRIYSEAPSYHYLEKDAETGYYRVISPHSNKVSYIAEDILYALSATTPPVTPGEYKDWHIYGLVNPIAALGDTYVVKNKVGTVTISADGSGYADLTGLETGDAIFRMLGF